MSGFNLSASAQALLTKVQDLFGADNVRVTSGARSVASNSALAGSSNTSQHLTGNAFDFVVAGMTPAQVQSQIATSGIVFGQSIQETGAAAGAGANHLGVGTKMQLLTGTNGKYTVTGVASAATVKSMGDQINAFGKSIGLGDSLGQAGLGLGAALSAPGNAIDDAVNKTFGGLDLSQWFERVTLAIFAILLIAVALFMLSGKSPVDVAKAGAKLAV